jgi:hypothetical protein
MQEIKESNFVHPNNVFIFNYHKYKIDEKYVNKYDKKFVLFTGQGVIYNEIINFFENGKKWLSENKLILVYKAHPSEEVGLNNPINKFCLNSESFHFESDNVLRESFISNCEAHIAVYSSCHFDAVDLIGKTYVFCPDENLNYLSFYSLKKPKLFIDINVLSEIKL